MNQPLSRRRMLRGVSASLALPLLDAMLPRRAFAATAPRRLAFIYVPNGIEMTHFTPASTGAGFDLPQILEPLAAHRDHFSVLSGLAHINGRALGDGAGDHARAAATFLTGVHPRKTGGADISAGVSADQVAAQALGGTTRFPSLELGCEDGRLVGNCDSGYSCAYSNSISWRTPSTPNPPEIDPRAVFERLFAGYDSADDAPTRARRARYRHSILDFVGEDARGLSRTLGPADRRKLDEYLAGVRAIELRIENAERAAERQPAPPLGQPAGVPPDYGEYARLMFDLLAAAFVTDATRVATLMLAREGSARAYPEIGIGDAHHPLTHHRNQEEMLAKVRRINVYHMACFAHFLERMKSTPDGDGSLLDHSMVVYGSGLSDGNRHSHEDLPCVLAGSGGGTISQGRHIRYPRETPMTDLWVTLLDRMGVRAEHLGDSRGRLAQLSGLT